MIRRLVFFIGLPVVTGLIAFFAAYFVFYRGGYEPPPAVEVPLPGVATSGVPAIDEAGVTTSRVQRGLVLVDALHGTQYRRDELQALQTRIAARGYDVAFFDVSRLSPGVGQSAALESSLRGATSYVVLFPVDSYPAPDAAAVERFVDKGGKLLLVGEPTRPNKINTLAERFGLKFQGDFLYNQVENDENYRHIFIRDFRPDGLTAGLNSISLYVAGSIQSSGQGLAFTDQNTHSSLVEGDAVHTPLAWGNSRNVLAAGDFTFMVPPYNSLLDNSSLLDNIADYLTTSERTYELADFPHFHDGSVDILPLQPSLINLGLELRNGLLAEGVSVQFSGVEDVSRDAIFLGLYEDSLQVSQYLQAAGVRIDDMLATPFAPELSTQGTAVTVLDQNQDRQVLVVLGDTPATLAEAVLRLVSGAFRSDLLSDNVAILSTSGASQPAIPEGPERQ